MEIHSIEPFLSYFENVRARTLRVISAIPPERLDWTYKEGAFTFADLIRHLAATERYMFAQNVQGLPSRYPGHARELADGPEAVLQYLERMHQESVAIFQRLSPEDLQRKCTTPGGVQMSIWKWLRSMVEHEVHHRGQIYLMLGMLNVPAPPLYGLTSEEVRERSIPPEP